MKLQGRKFVGMVLGLFVLIGQFVFVGMLVPTALTDITVVAFMVLQVTLIIAYIGGNVWSAWVKSKYFNSGLGGE